MSLSWTIWGGNPKLVWKIEFKKHMTGMWNMWLRVDVHQSEKEEFLVNTKNAIRF